MPFHRPLVTPNCWIALVISAFFLGLSGAIFGNMTGFIEPRDIAFPTTTFNIFMVLMVLLGGKGTLWGPVVGAVVFHVIKEVTWTYFLGWQYVALGLLIVIIVVYFQQGIVGWLMEKYPERFGIQIAPREPEETPRTAGLATQPGGAVVTWPENTPFRFACVTEVTLAVTGALTLRHSSDQKKKVLFFAVL